MGKVITVANQKGGVGKTTTVLNFGAELARRNRKVLLIDFDSQGNLTKASGITKKSVDTIPHTIADSINDCIDGKAPLLQKGRIKLDGDVGMDILPCNISMAQTKLKLSFAMAREGMLKKITDELKKSYDYILIDTAPSLDVDMVNALVAADELIITTTPDTFSTSGTGALYDSWKKVRDNLNNNLIIAGVLINCVDKRSNFTRDMIEVIRGSWAKKEITTFEEVIPLSVKVKEGQAIGKVISDYSHDNPVSKAYSFFTDEYLRKVEGNGTES